MIRAKRKLQQFRSRAGVLVASLVRGRLRFSAGCLHMRSDQILWTKAKARQVLRWAVSVQTVLGETLETQRPQHKAIWVDHWVLTFWEAVDFTEGTHQELSFLQGVNGNQDKAPLFGWKNEEKHGMSDVFRTAAAAALAQENPLTRSQTCPPCKPTAKPRRWRLSVLKAGQRGIRSPSKGQGGRGCFVMQATLRRSLGCNKTRQRYTLRVELPSLFELEDTQRSSICLLWLFVCLLGCFVCVSVLSCPVCLFGWL